MSDQDPLEGIRGIQLSSEDQAFIDAYRDIGLDPSKMQIIQTGLRIDDFLASDVGQIIIAKVAAAEDAYIEASMDWRIRGEDLEPIRLAFVAAKNTLYWLAEVTAMAAEIITAAQLEQEGAEQHIDIQE